MSDPLDMWVESLVDDGPPTLESVLVDPQWFGLESATPLQRAICRIIEGRPIDDLRAMPLIPTPEAYPPDLVERATWDWSVGSLEGLQEAPSEVYVVAAIRSGKSLLSGACGVWLSQTCDLSDLREGETARFPIVSVSKDLGGAIHEHVRGAQERSLKVRGLLVGEPTSEHILLRHPGGGVFDINIAAGRRAGSSLVARWLGGAVFDEAPRMLSSEEGVVNFEDQRKAILGRLRGPLLAVGSPYAPVGPVYRAVQSYWQKAADGTVVVRGVGPAFNPYWWTPARCWKLRERDMATYRTDVLGEFGDLESAALGNSELQAVTREGPRRVEPEAGVTYYAEMDPATRNNGWAVVVGGMRPNGKRAIVAAWEERSEDGSPLRPAEVMRRIAAELAPYSVSTVGTDQWAADALVDIGRTVGLHIVPENVTATTKAKHFDSLRSLVRAEEVELPPHATLQADLRRVRRRLTQDGGVRIVYPETADGRHCDYAGPVAKLLTSHMAEPEHVEPDVPKGWTQREWDDASRLDRHLEQMQREQQGFGVFDDVGMFE